MLDALLHQALFRFAPEDAHHHALGLLRTAAAAPFGQLALRRAYAPADDPTVVCGLRFPNRMGLAAGYDKDASTIHGLAALGFGHLELGTVTLQPQPGNPKPRVFRLTDDQVLVNRLGFPSAGADVVLGRVRQAKDPGCIIGINLGRNKQTSNQDAGQEYAELARRCCQVADYLTLNISSPNTPGLRALQQLDSVKAMVTGCLSAMERPVPLWVKLSPDLDDDRLVNLARALQEAGASAIVATNTTVGRPVACEEKGGMSGPVLGARSLEVLRLLDQATKLPLISVGGITTASDYRARLDAGASLVQVYTALVFQGPKVLRRLTADA